MEIANSRLSDFLKDPERAKVPVFLFYGDDVLCREALEMTADILVPANRKSLNQDTFDGLSNSTGQVIESLFTLPLFPAPKTVIWRETRILASKKETGAFLDRAKEAHEGGDAKKAASYLLEYMGVSGIALSDLDSGDPLSSFPSEKRGPWISELLELCRAEGMAVTPFTDDSDLLADALEKGLPQNHFLCVTAPVVDKRKRLYKVMAEKGLAVDCTIPQGGRNAEKNVQREILWDRAARVLAPMKKSLDRAAFEILIERVGPDVAAFTSALEKLAAHVGDRPKIVAGDVRDQISHTRSDPIYEFTSAVFARDPGRALSILGRILEGDFSAIGAVGALANQARKFLAVKAFMGSPHGRAWRRGMDSKAFEREVLPHIPAFDEHVAGLCASMRFSGEENEGPEGDVQVETPSPKGRKKAAGTKKSAGETDLFVAKKGTHPYVVYKNFETAEKFTEDELADALCLLLDADRRLKSTGQNPRLIVEAATLAICMGAAGYLRSSG